MKANETILQPVLEGTKQFIVPLFQRTYSWKSDNWKALWDDLMSLYTSESERKHFLGAFVSMPVDMTPAGVNKYLLIDGQQRITTLFLILAVIRDLAAEKQESNLADQINDLYLINKWAQGPNLLKLFPSQTDRDQFAKIIFKKTDLDTNNNTVKAYGYFRRKLEGKDPSGLPIDLNKMHTTLVQEIMVVNIVLDKDENPYLIFESLNAKGEPLTQADLVRNYILMRITDSDEQEVAYEEFWMPMQNLLGGELSRFIWRYLIKDNQTGNAIRLDEIYDDVKQRLSRAKSKAVVDLLMDMHTFAGYYNYLIDPDSELDKEIRKRLKRLNRWEVKTTYPFLLNIYRDYKAGKITSLDFCSVLDILESYVVRRSFSRIPTNVLNKTFLIIYKYFDQAQPAESISKELLQREWPGNTAFLNAWVDFPIYLSGTAKCRHILESLESASTNNNELVDITNEFITIEHIMPQTLNEEWEQMLGEEAVDVYDSYLHTIGNLTLTGSNGDLGNQSILQKKQIFAKSNFAITKDIADNIVWNKLLITQRAKKLGQLAVNIWKHPGEADQTLIINGASKSQDPTGKKPTGFSLFGSEYHVESWRDMLLTALEELAARYGSEFEEKAVLVKTNRRIHLALQKEGMITPMKIPGSSVWVEANQSSRSVLWVIKQTVNIFGGSEDDFEAYW